MPNLQGFSAERLSLQEQKLLTGQAAMARPCCCCMAIRRHSLCGIWLLTGWLTHSLGHA